MRLTDEELRQRATLQIEATRFAMFFFSWSVMHGRCPDTSEVPANGDMEIAVREAIRHFVVDHPATLDDFGGYLANTARATQANYFWYPAIIWGFADDEVRNLVAEELGFRLADTWLSEEEEIPASMLRTRLV